LGGGYDTKIVLPKGTPAEVTEHVKRRLETFLPDGGFVFNTVHNILAEVPSQNIVAMFEAIAEFRLC
jgi:uroporphyrinogen decarboxylase